MGESGQGLDDATTMRGVGKTLDVNRFFRLLMCHTGPLPPKGFARNHILFMLDHIFFFTGL